MRQYVFFDLDNTLTDRRATINAYAEYFLEQYKNRLKKDISVDYLCDTFNELDLNGYETHLNRSLAIQHLPIWNSPIDVDLLSLDWQDWIPNNAVPMDGAEGCLQELISRGFQLCLVSNGRGKNQRDKLKKLSFEHYFKAIVISGEVGFEKPDRRIFEYALDKMNCNARDAFFVGDHPENDCLASRALGFSPIWLEGAIPWPKNTQASQKIVSLKELVPLICYLVGQPEF